MRQEFNNFTKLYDNTVQSILPANQIINIYSNVTITQDKVNHRSIASVDTMQRNTDEQQKSPSSLIDINFC